MGGSTHNQSKFYRSEYLRLALVIAFISQLFQYSSAENTIDPTLKIDLNLMPVVQQTANLKQSLGEMPSDKRTSLVTNLRRSSPAFSTRQMQIDSEGFVQIDVIVSEWNQACQSTLQKLGGKIGIEKPEINRILCSLPADRIFALAAQDWVRRINKPNYGVSARATRPAKANLQADTSTVISEGVPWHRIDQYRDLTGQDGTGFSIGVISDGILRRAESQAAGELPADVTATSFRFDEDLEPGGEGTAILEQVHDALPGANLYFANAGSDLEFIEAINWLADNCDAIACDIIFFGLGPLDGGGYFERCISEAAQKVTVFGTSVGNQADAHYRGNFWDPDDDGWHNFSESREYISCSIEANKSLWATLSWNDHFQLEIKNGFSMRLIAEASGEILAQSEGLSRVGNDTHFYGYPTEYLFYDNHRDTSLACQLQIFGGYSDAREIHLHVSKNDGGWLNDFIVPQQSLVNVALSKGVQSVGAFDAESACTISGASPGEEVLGSLAYTIEPYSSFGPTSDGRMLPQRLYTDRIHTFTKFWTWDDEQSAKLNAYYDNGDPDVFNGTSACSAYEAGCSLATSQEVSEVVIGGQRISIPTIDNLNTVIEAVGSDGMLLNMTAGNGAPDPVAMQEWLTEFGDARFAVEVTPPTILIETTPIETESGTLNIHNPNEQVEARGFITFDPRLFVLPSTRFNISPGETKQIAVSNQKYLPEGRYQTSISIVHVGNPDRIVIPVELEIASAQPASVETADEQEPNNAANRGEVFTQGQSISLPEVTGGQSGNSVLRISGSANTTESSFKAHSRADDSEDWYSFTLEQEETLTFSVIPANATADLDLFLVNTSGSVMIAADEERDGWQEQIGPITLPADSYGIGVSIYDRNFPNSDGSYTDYETDYELTIQREPPLFAMQSVSLAARADAVVNAGGNALMWGRQGLDRTLYCIQSSPWEQVWDDTAYYPLYPLQRPQGSTQVGVIWDENPLSISTRIQHLRIYDFAQPANPVLSATLTPAETAATRKILYFAFSDDGSKAFFQTDSTLSRSRYELISMDVASGEEIGYITLPGSSVTTFSTFPERSIATVRSYNPDALTFYDLSGSGNPTTLGSVETGSSITNESFTTHKQGQVGFYVLQSEMTTLHAYRFADSATQEIDLQDTFRSMNWDQEGGRLLVATNSGLMVIPVDASGWPTGSTEIPYPNISVSYSPGKPITLDTQLVAMPIAYQTIWFVNLEELTGIDTLAIDPHTIQNMAYSPETHQLFVAGTEAVAISIDQDRLLGGDDSSGSIDPASQPQLFAYPNMLGFGNQPCGTIGNTGTTAIRNTGRVPVTITAIDFPQINFRMKNPPGLPLTIDAGEDYALSIQARPSTPGLLQEIMVIHSDDPIHPTQSILLSVAGRPNTRFVVGDVDEDGTLSGEEVFQAGSFWQKQLEEIPSAKKPAFNRCDADFNGTVDETDMLGVLKE